MKYQILPFRFARFNEEEYLLSNDVGEYIFLKNDDFHKFVKGELDPTSDLFYDIESKQIATTDNVEDAFRQRNLRAHDREFFFLYHQNQTLFS